MDTITTETIPQKTQSELAVVSDKGSRNENQDNYLIIRADGSYQHLKNEKPKRGHLENWQENHLRLIVADGMGGHKKGRQAAEALIESLLTLEFQTDPYFLREQLVSIHNKLFDQNFQGNKTPGSTLVMADIDPLGKALIANIGDSRVYHYHKKKWQQITHDHTAVEFAWRDNEISKGSYKQSLCMSNNQITQAVGFGSSGIIPDELGIKLKRHLRELRLELADDLDADKQSHTDIFLHTLEQGDILMLASDGIWSNQAIYTPAITEETSLKETINREVQTVIDNGATDNVTLIAFNF